MHMKALEAAELHNCRLSSHMPHQSTRVNRCKPTFFTFVCFSPMCKQRVASLLSSGCCWSTSTVLARPLPPQGTQPIFLGRGTRTANIFSWEPSDCEPQFSEASEISGTQHIGDITYLGHNMSGTQHIRGITYRCHNISGTQHICSVCSFITTWGS